MDPTHGTPSTVRSLDVRRPPAGADARMRLVFALCHEVGNWAAAIRLQEQLIDVDMDPRELADASIRVGDLAARIGAALPLVRPLLSALPRGTGAVDARNIARAVTEALHEYGRRGVDFVVQVTDGSPSLPCDLAEMKALVCTQVFYAIEAARPDGHVRLNVHRDTHVCFEIADDGPASHAPLAWRNAEMCGRALGVAIAHELVGDLGGSVEVSRHDSQTAIVLRVPVDATPHRFG